MATYDVDIEPGPTRLRKTKALSTALRQVTKDVGKLNTKNDQDREKAEPIKIHIQNADNYSKAVKRAERALRKPLQAHAKSAKPSQWLYVRVKKQTQSWNVKTLY